YRVEVLVTPPAVYREVGRTDLLSTLAALPWIHVENPEAGRLRALMREEPFQRLGPGEQEVLALALQQPGAVVLMNDNQARRQALRLNLEAVNILALLLPCKLSSVIYREKVGQLVDLLRERDRYGFRR